MGAITCVLCGVVSRLVGPCWCRGQDRAQSLAWTTDSP